MLPRRLHLGGGYGVLYSGNMHCSGNQRESKGDQSWRVKQDQGT